MRDETAIFKVGRNRELSKRYTTGHFENETKAPICINTGRRFRSVIKRNINETEIPPHKTTYFDFCGPDFFVFSGIRIIWDGYYQFRCIEKRVS